MNSTKPGVEFSVAQIRYGKIRLPPSGQSKGTLPQITKCRTVDCLRYALAGPEGDTHEDEVKYNRVRIR